MQRLSNLGELRSGFQLRGAAKHNPNGAQAVIQLGDVGDEGIDARRLVRMNLERARDKDYVFPGDILLRSRGASYRAALVHDCPPQTVAATPLYVLSLNRPGFLDLCPVDVMPEYLVWFINRPVTQALLAAQARGTHIPTVGIEAFGDLEIVIPPVPDQKQIIETNQLLEQEKTLTGRLLEKREQLAQALLDRFIREEGR